MNIQSIILSAEPEGVLALFMFGVPIEQLAKAFGTNIQDVEASLREAIRKRESVRNSDVGLRAVAAR